jgi:hypothetical protein
MKTALLSVAAVALVAGSGGAALANGQKAVAAHRTVVVRTAVTHTPVVHAPVVQKTVVQKRVIHAPVVHPAHTVPAAFRDWHVTHGVRFSHGVFFRGREFRFFAHRHWNPRYRCWTFFYPGTNCYYYWSAANGGFYPLSYAPVVAPNGALPDGNNALPDDPDALTPDDGTSPQ